MCVDVYAKPTISFIYVLLFTCYPEGNMNHCVKSI